MNTVNNCPHWKLVMEYFGLDTSFQWPDDKVKVYSSLYQEEMEMHTLVSNKLEVMQIDALISKIDSLNSTAASDEGCSVDTTVVSVDQLEKLVELADCIKLMHQRVSNAGIQSSTDETCNISISVDGGETFIKAPSGVRICYADVAIPGEDGLGELHLTASTEGLIMDLWTTREEPLDHNIATSAEMVDDLAARLLGDTSNDDLFECVNCHLRFDIESSVTTVAGLMCPSCVDSEDAITSIQRWQGDLNNGLTSLGYQAWRRNQEKAAVIL